MNARDVQGIFIQRKGIFAYDFQAYAGSVETVTLDLHPEPVMRMVQYVLRINLKTQHATILDAIRLPWCKDFHNTYMPKDEPFSKTFDKSYYDKTNIPPEVVSWALHDARYHIRRLLPDLPAAMFPGVIEMLKRGDYATVVRTHHVDASILRRFLPDKEDALDPVVEEAVVFAEYAERMIRYRCVWLSGPQLSGLITDNEWWRMRCGIMLGLGLLRTKQKGDTLCVALGWAVDLLDASTATGSILAGEPPLKLPTGGTFRVDPRYSVEAFVRCRELATSMSENLSGVSPPFDNPAVNMSSFTDMLTYVRSKIGDGMKRTLTFTQSGELSFDPYLWVTALIMHQNAKSVVMLGSKTLNHSTVNIWKSDGTTSVISSSTLYGCVRAISRDRLANLHKYPKDLDVDFIIAVLDKSSDPGIYLELERFRAPKILVNL